MPGKYFKRRGGKWTSVSGDVLAGLAGARLTVVQSASWALRALLDEGAEIEWAERVFEEFAGYRRGEGWAPFLLRMNFEDLERWGMEGTALGKLDVGEWLNIVSPKDAESLSEETLTALADMLQTRSVTELVRRGEGEAAVRAMEKSKWFLRRTPDAVLTAALSAAEPRLRENYAAVAATSGSASWIEHAAEVALSHPAQPPSSLVGLLHDYQEKEAYLAAATVLRPHDLRRCRETEGGVDCCRAFAVMTARRKWETAGRRGPPCVRRWEMKSGGCGELAVGNFPPLDEGWELIRKLPEGAWEWRSEVWQGLLL